MKRCGKCGSLIDDEDRFCTYCGSSQEETVKNGCPYCGGSVKENDKFCPSCGRELLVEDEKSYREEVYEEDGTPIFENGEKRVRISPFEAYGRYWRRIFDFRGRSTRQEFWWPYIFNMIISYILLDLSNLVGGQRIAFEILGTMYEESLAYAITYVLTSIVFFIPTLSNMVRRIRDTGRSPFYIFMIFIPIVGEIIILVNCIRPTNWYRRQK